MADPSLPPNTDEIEAVVDQALHGLELESHETAAVLGFANKEIPYLHTPDTSYLVLGSYRDPYIRRLRKAQNELNKRLSSYPFVMGDLPELGLDRLPEFRIRFHLLATYADYIVGVYEQDSGGEITELGKISETPYFNKSYVLPRDYSWKTGENPKGKADIVDTAMRIYHNDDLTDDEKESKIGSLAAEAQEVGISVSKEELIEAVEEREDENIVSYSWVQRNEFRLFELHGRCQPWVVESELRDAVDIVPSPESHPGWEIE